MSTSPLHRDTAELQDRRALLLIFCTFTLCYAYFFQGGGFNQNSHFDTVRALVERGTTEITAYAGNTGDIGSFQGHIYSNKAPGLAFLCAPIYFVAYRLERGLGLDTSSASEVTANAHLVTFFTSGLPGVVLVLLLYRHFRGQGATPREGLWLAAAFGMGSLALPYSGVMMDHLLVACLLFGAWSVLAGAPLSRRAALWAGLLSGMAILTDSLAVPAVALFFCYVTARRAHVAPFFLLGAALLTGALLAHNYACFGSPFVSNKSIETVAFRSTGQLFGLLDWPQPIRLFWLTFHPFRGLFLCCPVLMVSFLSMRLYRPLWAMTLETGIPLAIVAYHFLFNMSFNGWTGGWCVGPRYLIPALPFLYSFALAGSRRFRVVTTGLAVLSAAMMICVSAVLVMVPGPNQGPPPYFSPVRFCFDYLGAGMVSISTTGMLDIRPTFSNNRPWASYNLGELAGLHGVASLIPIGLALLAFVLLARRLTRESATGAGPTAGC